MGFFKKSKNKPPAGAAPMQELSLTSSLPPDENATDQTSNPSSSPVATDTGVALLSLDQVKAVSGVGGPPAATNSSGLLMMNKTDAPTESGATAALLAPPLQRQYSAPSLTEEELMNRQSKLSLTTGTLVRYHHYLDVIFTNVLPVLLILAMIFSNSMMQSGLHIIVKDFQTACSAASLHVDWLGGVSLSVGSTVNTTKSLISQIDVIEDEIIQSFNVLSVDFAKCVDTSKFDTTEHQIEYLTTIRDTTAEFKSYVDTVLEYPLNYLDIFDHGCLQLPAVLRNAPFFDTPNKLCVGTTTIKTKLLSLHEHATTIANSTFARVDPILDAWASAATPPPDEICIDLEYSLDADSFMFDTSNIKTSLHDFLIKIDEAVRYLNVLTASFSATHSVNEVFLKMDVFQWTVLIFVISTLLDISIIFLPKPTNAKVNIGKKKIVVNVVEASKLVAKDMNGRSDPYCVVSMYPPPLEPVPENLDKMRLAAPKKKLTRVVYGSLNPVWDQTLEFYLEGHEKECRVELYDKDILSQDDYMGEIRIPMKHVSETPTPSYIWHELLNYDHPKEDVSGVIKVLCHVQNPLLQGEFSQQLRDAVQATLDFLTSSVLRRTLHLLAIVFNVGIVALCVVMVVVSCITIVFPHYYLCFGLQTVVDTVFVLFGRLLVDATDLVNELLDAKTIGSTLELDPPEFNCSVFTTESFSASTKYFLIGALTALIVQFNVFALLSHKYGSPRGVFKPKKEEVSVAVKQEQEDTSKAEEHVAVVEHAEKESTVVNHRLTRDKSFLHDAERDGDKGGCVRYVLKVLGFACNVMCFPCRASGIICVYLCKLLRTLFKYLWRIVRRALKYARIVLKNATWAIVCCPCIVARLCKQMSKKCHTCIDPYYKNQDREELVRHPAFYFIIRWFTQHADGLFTFLLLIVGNSMVVSGMGKSIGDFGAAFESGTPYIGWVGNITLDLRNSTEFLKEYIEEVTDLDDEILALSNNIFNATDETCEQMSDFYDEMHDILEDVAAGVFGKTKEPLEIIGVIVEACSEFELNIDPVLFTSAYMSVPNQLCDGAEFVLEKLTHTVRLVDNTTDAALVMLEQGDSCVIVSKFLRESPLHDYFDFAEDALDYATKEVLGIIDQMQTYLDLVSVSASSTGSAVDISVDLDVFSYLALLFVLCQLVSGVVLFGPAISQEAKPHGKPRAYLQLVSGKGLAAKDLGKDGKPGSSDPYVIVTSGKHILKTKYRKKTVDPVFNTIFQWSIDDDDEFVTIRVFDYDFMSSDDFMGEVRFCLDDLDMEEDGKEVDYDLQKSDLYPGDFVKGTIRLKIFRKERYRWLACCGKACVGDETEEKFDVCFRGLLSAVFRTLQKSAFHWLGFVLNISLLGLYLGFFVLSFLLVFLPWQSFCDAGEDGLSQVFMLVDMIVEKGMVLANELLDVGTISSTLNLQKPEFNCRFLGDEQHKKANDILVIGLFLCVLGQYHIFGIISNKYKLGANLGYKKKKKGTKGGERGEEDEVELVVDAEGANPMRLEVGEGEGGTGKGIEIGTEVNHVSKERALLSQRTKNLERQSSVVREGSFMGSMASERVSTAKAHTIFRSYLVSKDLT